MTFHSHFDSFKSIIETDFKHLKEATSRNMQNIQISLGIQQTYSSTLCSHINSIYNKLSKLQKHKQHCCMYPHQIDTVQINTPEYDLDIDGDNQPNTDKNHATWPHKFNKKLIGLMLPPSRYQVFLQQHQISHQRLRTTALHRKSQNT